MIKAYSFPLLVETCWWRKEWGSVIEALSKHIWKWKECILPGRQGKRSNLHIRICESFFPLVHEDRLLRSRVPNKYLVGGEAQTAATLVTCCSLNALVRCSSPFQRPHSASPSSKTDSRGCRSDRTRLGAKSFLSVNPALAACEEEPPECVIVPTCAWPWPASSYHMIMAISNRQPNQNVWPLNVFFQHRYSSSVARYCAAEPFRVSSFGVWTTILEKDGKANRGLVSVCVCGEGGWWLLDGGIKLIFALEPSFLSSHRGGGGHELCMGSVWDVPGAHSHFAQV